MFNFICSWGDAHINHNDISYTPTRKATIRKTVTNVASTAEKLEPSYRAGRHVSDTLLY